MFLKDTPFCAIPFEETEAREGLEMRLDIASYPTLVMLGPRPIDDDDNFGETKKSENEKVSSSVIDGIDFDDI